MTDQAVQEATPVQDEGVTLVSAEKSEAEARKHPVWGDDKFKVSYVGPFLYPTGYGEASRIHAKAMQDAGAGVMARLNQMPPAGLQYELIRDEHRINEMLDKDFWPEDEGQRDPNVWLWHVTPDSFQRSEGKPNVGYAVWETKVLPEGWAEHCNKMDALMTASEFSAGHFRDAGVTKPIYIAPHPIDGERFSTQVDGSRFRSGFGDTKTVFTVVSQWMFRKAVEDAVVAYASEFDQDEPVALVLLVWRWSHSYPERTAVKEYTKFLLAGLNKSGTPPIYYIGDKLAPSALPILYSGSDVLVSPSRGEAFCLPVFEAAACGRPSICTGWGGMWDYLDDGSAYRVAYDLETVHGSGPKWKHYTYRQKWARIDLDDLRRAMREAHEDVAGRKRKGMAARKVVEDRLSYRAVGDGMVRDLRQVVDGGPKAS